MSPLTCPSCDSSEVVKNGRIHNGKQNHKCRARGRQFVEDPQQKRIDPAFFRACQSQLTIQS
jgi:transposase-like protein